MHELSRGRSTSTPSSSPLPGMTARPGRPSEAFQAPGQRRPRSASAQPPPARRLGRAGPRTQTEQVRVVVRAGLGVLVARLLPLAGAVLPRHARELALTV